MKNAWHKYQTLLKEALKLVRKPTAYEEVLAKTDTTGALVHESLARLSLWFISAAIVLALDVIINLIFSINRGSDYFLVYFLSMILSLVIMIALSLLAASVACDKLALAKKKGRVLVFALCAGVLIAFFGVLDALMGFAFPGEHLLLLIAFSAFAPCFKRDIALSMMIATVPTLLSFILISHWNGFFCGAYALLALLLLGLLLLELRREERLYISAKKAENARLLFANDTLEDAETGVLSRRGFEASLVEAVQRSYGGRLYVMLLDVDGFTDYLKTYGRREAIKVLREIAQELKAEMRPKDILSRHATSQFVIVFTGLSREEAITKARGFKKSVALLAIASATPKKPCLSASAGLADCTILYDLNIEHELARADAELERAKALGGDCLLYGGTVYR